MTSKRVYAIVEMESALDALGEYRDEGSYKADLLTFPKGFRERVKAAFEKAFQAADEGLDLLRKLHEEDKS
jgi:hypothetical protein